MSRFKKYNKSFFFNYIKVKIYKKTHTESENIIKTQIDSKNI